MRNDQILPFFFSTAEAKAVRRCPAAHMWQGLAGLDLRQDGRSRTVQVRKLGARAISFVTSPQENGYSPMRNTHYLIYPKMYTSLVKGIT